jgi:GntR family transcriptional regulator
MRLRIDPHSGEPLWRQIVEQIKFCIASGQLTPGDRLPSIRTLSDLLKINPRTVVKAYEKLDALALVRMRHGQGVFVADANQRDTAVPAAARRKILEELIRRLLAEAIRLGVGPDDVVQMVKELGREMRHEERLPAR